MVSHAKMPHSNSWWIHVKRLTVVVVYFTTVTLLRLPKTQRGSSVVLDITEITSYKKP